MRKVEVILMKIWENFRKIFSNVYKILKEIAKNYRISIKLLKL